MPTQQAVLDALAPVARVVAGLDLTQPAAAEEALRGAIAPEALGEVGRLLRAAQAEGWLTPKRGGPDTTFGRLSKPTEAMSGMSVDVVEMRGAGMEHVHPTGEVSLCFTQDGDPRFDGRPEGFVVLPPGSRHVPTVTGGKMLIVYFLPAGAVEWVGA